MNQGYIVFTGRPNAGKSILIRKITGLDAKSGKRPGTTNEIKLYHLSKDLILVDMPGYGRITKRSRKREGLVKDQIIEFIENHGSSIVLTVHIIDASTYLNTSQRLENKGIIPIDIEMIQFLNENTSSQSLIVLNKIDKINNKTVEDCLEDLQIRLENIEATTIFTVSAKKGEGIGHLKKAIHDKLIQNGFKYPFRPPK